jgi:hypothetical protein
LYDVIVDRYRLVIVCIMVRFISAPLAPFVPLGPPTAFYEYIDQCLLYGLVLPRPLPGYTPASSRDPRQPDAELLPFEIMSRHTVGVPLFGHLLWRDRDLVDADIKAKYSNIGDASTFTLTVAEVLTLSKATNVHLLRDVCAYLFSLGGPDGDTEPINPRRRSGYKSMVISLNKRISDYLSDAAKVKNFSDHVQGGLLWVGEVLRIGYRPGYAVEDARFVTAAGNAQMVETDAGRALFVASRERFFRAYILTLGLVMAKRVISRWPQPTLKRVRRPSKGARAAVSDDASGDDETDVPERKQLATKTARPVAVDDGDADGDGDGDGDASAEPDAEPEVEHEVDIDSDTSLSYRRRGPQVYRIDIMTPGIDVTRIREPVWGELLAGGAVHQRRVDLRYFRFTADGRSPRVNTRVAEFVRILAPFALSADSGVASSRSFVLTERTVTSIEVADINRVDYVVQACRRAVREKRYAGVLPFYYEHPFGKVDRTRYRYGFLNSDFHGDAIAETTFRDRMYALTAGVLPGVVTALRIAVAADVMRYDLGSDAYVKAVKKMVMLKNPLERSLAHPPPLQPLDEDTPLRYDVYGLPSATGLFDAFGFANKFAVARIARAAAGDSLPVESLFTRSVLTSVGGGSDGSDSSDGGDDDDDDDIAGDDVSAVDSDDALAAATIVDTILIHRTYVSRVGGAPTVTYGGVKLVRRSVRPQLRHYIRDDHIWCHLKHYRPSVAIVPPSTFVAPLLGRRQREAPSPAGERWRCERCHGSFQVGVPLSSGHMPTRRHCMHDIDVCGRCYLRCCLDGRFDVSATAIDLHITAPTDLYLRPIFPPDEASLALLTSNRIIPVTTEYQIVPTSFVLFFHQESRMFVRRIRVKYLAKVNRRFHSVGVMMPGNVAAIEYQAELSQLWAADIYRDKTLCCSACGIGFTAGYYCQTIGCHHGRCYKHYSDGLHGADQPVNYPVGWSLPDPGRSCSEASPHGPHVGRDDQSYVIIRTIIINIRGLAKDAPTKGGKAIDLLADDPILQSGIGVYILNITLPSYAGQYAHNAQFAAILAVIPLISADRLVIHINGHRTELGFLLGNATLSAEAVVTLLLQPLIRTFRSRMGVSSTDVFVYLNVCEVDAGTWDRYVQLAGGHSESDVFSMVVFRYPVIIAEMSHHVRQFLRVWLNRVKSYDVVTALRKSMSDESWSGMGPSILRYGHSPEIVHRTFAPIITPSTVVSSASSSVHAPSPSPSVPAYIAASSSPSSSVIVFRSTPSVLPVVAAADLLLLASSPPLPDIVAVPKPPWGAHRRNLFVARHLLSLTVAERQQIGVDQVSRTQLFNNLNTLVGRICPPEFSADFFVTSMPYYNCVYFRTFEKKYWSYDGNADLISWTGGGLKAINITYTSSSSTIV